MRPLGHTRRAFWWHVFHSSSSYHTRGLTEDISWFFLVFTALSIEDIFWWEWMWSTHTASWSRRRAVKKACFLGSNINTTRSPSFKEASQLYPTNLIATPHEVRPCDTSSSIGARLLQCLPQLACCCCCCEDDDLFPFHSCFMMSFPYLFISQVLL